MNGHSLLYRGYGASVRVDVPEHMDLRGLSSFVAPEVSVEVGADGPADLLVTRWGRVYHLVVGERRYGPYRTDVNAFRGISNGIHFVLGKRSPMTFVHAGAVEIDGAAVVFPGRSRWGKSTLVSDLVDQGCGYLSDEYAVVSPEGSVFPFSKPIRLRRDEYAEYRRPQGVSALGGLPCLAVVLTRFDEESSWNPKIISRGNAVLGILPSTLQGHEEPGQVLEALNALVKGAVCYQGNRGSGEPTAAALRALGAGNGLRRGAQA
jgi:hypothetical protein